MSVVTYSTSPTEFDDWELEIRPALEESAAPTDFDDWELEVRPAVEVPINEELLFRWPYPTPGGVSALYSQRCVDTVTGLWTPWKTNYQDIYGSRYPGAGFDFSTYRIETIFYTREQES